MMLPDTSLQDKFAAQDSEVVPAKLGYILNNLLPSYLC